LAAAIEAEVAAWIDEHAHLKDLAGRQQVVRNGHLPERTIQTGIGAVDVKQPRVRDRRPADQREAFTSAILPPYLRKTKSLEGVIPWLYLKGVSTGDFSEALQALLGPNAPGLSAASITRLKAIWEDEYQTWSKRSLRGKRYVYVWADGVHFNIRLEGGRQCILVLMGATAEGKKELIAIADGYRESEQSWKELLLDCKARGLAIEPHLAIGDGALGFWKAMRQVWDTTQEQRCWVHKLANVLDKLPKGSQAKAKGMLHEIYLAESRAEADKAFDLFVSTYEAKYPKATECLVKDREVLLRFYDYPAEHWMHIRTVMVQREMEFLRSGDKVVDVCGDGSIFRLRTNPEGKTGAASCRPSRSWSLGRRSGRVATEPYPPPKPSAIVKAFRIRGNDLQWESHGGPTCLSGLLPPFSCGLQLPVALGEDRLLTAG
jgi:putative transposase